MEEKQNIKNTSGTGQTNTMTTEIKHKKQGCNGWCVVTKDQLTTKDSRNYHIVEAKVYFDAKSQVNKVASYNPSLETCCGLHIIKDASYQTGSAFLEAEVDKLRLFLAEKQNGNWEICGNCVGHFYKDPPQA